jgi:methionyl-tRNA formyltransferase
MRALLFGMPGRLAGPALAALLDSGLELAGIAVPAPPGLPPVSAAPRPGRLPETIALGTAPPPDLLAIAAANGLPALALRSLGDVDVRVAISELRPDLIVVACWPWRIPSALLAVPRLGCLNLHPSPLPELRGPEPLFWTLREGRAQSAVTLHWMDEGLDTGPIAVAGPLALPVGIGWEEAEDRAAAVGAGLLRELLSRLLVGERPSRPQGPGGSYRPAPSRDDFGIEPSWSAERAFRFLRGTAAWNLPFSITVAGHSLSLGPALSYDVDGGLDQPVIVADRVVRLQMSPGVLTARLW